MTIQDLSVLLAAIDLAVKRGAFSILEIGQVGAVAEKLNSFLAEAQKQAEAQKEAQADGSAEATAEDSAEASTTEAA